MNNIKNVSMVDGKKKDEQWEWVNTGELAEALANHDYKQLVKGVPVADIEVADMIERSGQVYVEVDTHSRWVLLYKSLIEGYKVIISEYTKKKVK